MAVLEKILYVEDGPDIQAVTKIALEAVGGFVVKVFDSGAVAVAQAEEFAPDLLLLDVMMPGMDGPATLARLREVPALRDTAVMFMTAKVQPKEIERFKSLGAIAVIAKPFDPMSLADEIKARWQAQVDGGR